VARVEGVGVLGTEQPRPHGKHLRGTRPPRRAAPDDDAERKVATSNPTRSSFMPIGRVSSTPKGIAVNGWEIHKRLGERITLNALRQVHICRGQATRTLNARFVEGLATIIGILTP
jgi:hypothetical protein